MLNSIGGFKFGGMVWYLHAYMHTVEILADYRLAHAHEGYGTQFVCVCVCVCVRCLQAAYKVCATN